MLFFIRRQNWQFFYFNQLFSVEPKIYNVYQSFSYLLQIFGLNRIECSGYVNRAKPETEMDRVLKAIRKCVKTKWVMKEKNLSSSFECAESSPSFLSPCKRIE